MVERIFISYRRDDSAGHAGRVFDRLKGDFGGDVLFMDVDAIPLGANFVRVLREEVGRCSVLLAIIGPGWLDARDADGERRLENPNDFVRVEIATALARDIPVIPILLDGGRIPKAQALPGDLQELSQRNGLDVRHASFHADMDKLVRGLRAYSAKKGEVHAIANLNALPVASNAPNERNARGAGFMQSALETAAGVAGGMLAANAIHNMMKGEPPHAEVGGCPTPSEAIEAKGQWAKEFELDSRGIFSPSLFGHVFIVVQPDFTAPGNIDTGLQWAVAAGGSRTPFPVWSVLHGFVEKRDVCQESADSVTYLGPTWRPEYAHLSHAVFKKLGGKPLARFIQHP